MISRRLVLSGQKGPPTLAPNFMFERLRRIIALGMALAGAPFGAWAAEPELSADEPISVDFETQELVAQGNARFAHDDIIVEGDEIRFDQNERTITATGNVRVTRRGLRIVTEELRYQIDTRHFASGRFRAGSPPLFASGESFEGTIDELEVRGGRFYYQEPVSGSPAITLDEATIIPGERIAGEGVSLDLPWLFGIPLPAFNRELGAPSMSVDGNLGYRGRLGAYIRTEVLAPVNENLRFGGNLDVYSRRGVLIGPALRYRRNLDEGSTEVYVAGGWIADQGDREEDVLLDPIRQDRSYATISAHHRSGDFEAVLQSTFLSDSEFERDFRPDRFSTRPHPHSFLEVNQLLGDWFLSVFVERMPNDFYRTVESLPEVTLEMPLRPLGDTGWVHGAKLRYQRLRLFGEFNEAAFERYEGRLPWLGLWPESELETKDVETSWAGLAEAIYSLRYPMTLNRWVALTPVAEARYESWEGNGSGLPTGTEASDAIHAAAGFDLEATLHGQWDLQNETWSINGLRHLIRPILQYRYLFSDDRTPGYGYFPQFRTTRPEVDMLTRRDRMESRADEHFFRVGIRNSWQTRGANGGVRELLAINLYHDHRTDAAENRALPSTYVEVSTQPARWLEFAWEQRIQTDEGTVEEFRVRSTFRSADSWEVTLAADYFDAIYHQYRIYGSYRLSPTVTAIGSWRYDARLETLTSQLYGLRYQVARSWEIEAGIVLREGAQREDDLSFHLGLRLVEF